MVFSLVLPIAIIADGMVGVMVLSSLQRLKSDILFIDIVVTTMVHGVALNIVLFFCIAILFGLLRISQPDPNLVIRPVPTKPGSR